MEDKWQQKLIGAAKEKIIWERNWFYLIDNQQKSRHIAGF
jgi:hypothetical protein